jgi:hypothetical protein
MAKVDDSNHFLCCVQDPFAQGSEQFIFNGEIYLDAQNKYIAELHPSGIVRIFRSVSEFKPLKIQSLVMQVSPDVPDIYPLLYNVSVNGAWRMVQAPSGGLYSTAVYSGIRLISSGAWSPEGTDFFIVWMDGMISRASLPLQASFPQLKSKPFHSSSA